MFKKKKKKKVRFEALWLTGRDPGIRARSVDPRPVPFGLGMSRSLSVHVCGPSVSQGLSTSGG